MSPSLAIRRFETVIRKHGPAQSLSGRVKREREAWITAVWALGLHEITGQEYWIEIETRDQTPDCKVHQLDQRSGNNRILTLNVEVVEWEQHQTDAIDVIRQKCAKAYPQYFTLLVFARNGESVCIDELLQQIKTLTVPFCEIWLLGRLSASAAKYGIFMLHPYSKLVEFDLGEVFDRNKAQIDFLKRQKRGRGTEVQDLGIVYVPIP